MGCDLGHPIEGCWACAIEDVLGLVDAGVGELLEIVGVIVDDIEEEAFDLGSDCGGVGGFLDELLELGVEGARGAGFLAAVKEEVNQGGEG